MKKGSLFVGFLLIASLLSGCAEFDRSAYRSDRYDNGGSNHSGHSH
jgi:hypothetical protein